MQELNKKIEYLLDQFDFSRVEKTMEALDWRWYDTPWGSPSVPDLRQTARKLLLLANKKSEESSQEVTIGTGGFYAEADVANDYLKLSFIVEVEDTELYDDDYFSDETDDEDEEEATNIFEFPREV
jgi:hypothetical protein